MGWVVTGAVVAAALLLTALYDRRQRRRGGRLRGGGEISSESNHHRIDINAVAYEPVRQPGQRDWATYRARDRKPPPG